MTKSNGNVNGNGPIDENGKPSTDVREIDWNNFIVKTRLTRFDRVLLGLILGSVFGTLIAVFIAIGQNDLTIDQNNEIIKHTHKTLVNQDKQIQISLTGRNLLLNSINETVSKQASITAEQVAREANLTKEEQENLIDELSIGIPELRDRLRAVEIQLSYGVNNSEAILSILNRLNETI